MIKRIVISGCRNYDNYKSIKEFADICLSKICNENEIIILSGGCKGVDLLGEKYAGEKGYQIERFLANWQKYGNWAGPKRNEEMAKKCDYVICFWDGESKGTKSMIKYAKMYNKPIKIKLI